MVEDNSSAQYEPVSLDDGEPITGTEGIGAEGRRNKPTGPSDATAPMLSQPQPTSATTSSLRAINRLIYSDGGIRSYFRGFACFFVYGVATSFLFAFFSLLVPMSLASSIASLISSLLLVQLSSAWVHIVISPRSPKHFWHRLPAFRSTFKAIAPPIVVYWLALQVANAVPFLLGWLLNLPPPSNDTSQDGLDNIPSLDFNASWKILVIVLLTSAVSLFVVVPAHVVLVRVQASLLPDIDDTIVPFDRSFGGHVVPLGLDGKSHASMTDAWRSFSHSDWRRLVFLYIKIYAIAIASGMVVGFICGLQISLIKTVSS